MQKLVSCVLLGWSWCCVSCDLKTCLLEDSFGDGNANDELSVALQAKQEVYDGSMTLAGEDCNKPYQACIEITGCGWSIEDKKCISFTPKKIKHSALKAKDALVSVVDSVNSPPPNCNLPYQKCIQTNGCGWSIQQRKCIVFTTSSSNEQSVDLVQASAKRMISKAKLQRIRQKIRQLQAKLKRKKIVTKKKQIVHLSRRRGQVGQYYNRFNPDHSSCDWKAQKLQVKGGGTISISSHSRRGRGTRRRSTDCLWTSRHFDLRGGGEATVAIRRFEGVAAPRRRLVEQFARRRSTLYTSALTSTVGANGVKIVLITGGALWSGIHDSLSWMGISVTIFAISAYSYFNIAEQQAAKQAGEVGVQRTELPAKGGVVLSPSESTPLTQARDPGANNLSKV